MTREQIMNEYQTKDDRIISPGKFEGEPIFVPALWELMLEYGSPSENKAFGPIPRHDPLRVEWPELDAWLGRRWTIRLWEDAQGFVHCR